MKENDTERKYAMNEVKRPKKPLIYYYVVVMTLVALFNLLLMPNLMQMQIKEVVFGSGENGHTQAGKKWPI